MNPIQPPPPSSTTRNSNRRRPNLTLPLPERTPSSFAVPLPLPPPSSAISGGSSQQQQQQQTTQIPVSFSELDKERRVGSGSGGTVYKVRHRPTGRSFALKVIYGTHEDSVLRQICREIEILRQVNNPNVVRCHGMFDHAGEIQVLLEYMDGGSLEGTHITNESILSDLSHQILSGLSYLHRRKIVHRDIKPSNLLINGKKQVKIADFGVSRILAQTMDPCNSSVGTIAYMSPERIDTDLNDGVYDGYAGDIWSFGVSILEFYMGRFPFNVSRGADWASLMTAICISPPPEAPSSSSKEFKSFLGCCLQREPSKRWTSDKLLLHPFITQLNHQVQNQGHVQNQNQVLNQIHHQLHLPQLQQQQQHVLPAPQHFSSSHG